MAIAANTACNICATSAHARVARARMERRRGLPGAEAEPSNPFPMYQPALKMLDAKPVGNYAIQIDWSDGHKAGIYSYEHFRQICPCCQ